MQFYAVVAVYVNRNFLVRLQVRAKASGEGRLIILLTFHFLSDFCEVGRISCKLHNTIASIDLAGNASVG